MKNLRTPIALGLFMLLLGTLAACIVESRPDRSMVIYIPPPVADSAGHPDLRIMNGTIPGTIPQPIAPALLAEAQRALTVTATVTLSESVPLTGTVTPTVTEHISATPPVTTTASPSGTLTPVATQDITPAPSGTALATGCPVANPTGSGTRLVTPMPTSQATATTPASSTATTTRTPTATRQPTATATRQATATPATPVATATPIPRTVFIGRNVGFVADSSYFVVGEVLNGDAYPVFNVKVIGSFYDSNNNLVAAQESVTVFHQIEPELSSPFRLQVSGNAGSIDHYELILVWDDVSVVDYEELTVESAEVDADAGVISGNLRNEGSVSVQDTAVVVTLYDDENNVVNVILGTVEKPVLGTGETTRYTIPLPPDVEFERIEVQAQGALKLF
ncbi:MAG: FxLYD domain-containing protein [Caldilineaceae bacterium]|nr:FxLYD domain-containing protein [Caldilineaceae bacterium]